jgi:hypothetical protein
MNVRELRVILLNVTDDETEVTVEYEGNDYPLMSIELNVEPQSDEDFEEITGKVVRMCWE